MPPITSRRRSGPDEVGRLGPYRVLSELGRGGMGVVFRAEDPRLKRNVALKVLLPALAADPQAKARFVREAQAQAKVEHDHVTPIFHIGETNGVVVLVMPLLRGQTLTAALKASPRPPLHELLRIGREMAEGLAAAHAVGLIHRDIKPANVWLEGNKRRVKILDFGLARAAGVADAGQQATTPALTHDGLTAHGAVLGTPAYMAPEQARGHAVDHRTDLWSLGVVIYEMAMGKRPFTGGNALEVMASVVTDQPLPVVGPDLPPALSALIHRLLAKDAADRPQTADAVAAELAMIAQGFAPPSVQVFPVGVVPHASDPWADIDATETILPTAKPDAPPPPRTRPPATTGRWLWVAVAAAALVAVLVAGLAIRHSSKQPAEQVKEQPQTQRPARAPYVPKVDADRELAKLVIAKKGVVKIDSEPNYLYKLDQLPTTPFRLIAVNMHPPVSLPFTDEEIEKFAGADQLTEIYLNGGEVTDAGVARLLQFPFAAKLKTLQLCVPLLTNRGAAHVARCPALTTLIFYNNPLLTDDGLACLDKMPQLRNLEFDRTAVVGHGLKHLRGENLTRLFAMMSPSLTDEAIPYVARCPQLTELHLDTPNITDAGLMQLAKLDRLQKLTFNGQAITDRGLETLTKLPNLSELTIYRGSVTDNGMEYVARLSKLTSFYIDCKQLTDAGLEKLYELKFLRLLNLSYADKVTSAGIRKLRAAMPSCNVLTLLDKKADRKAAEWALALGGQVYSGGTGVTDIKALPAVFELNGLELWASPGPITAADLEALRDTDRLNGTLVLPGIDDAGLKKLSAFGFAPKLNILVFTKSTITDEGLAPLARFTKLRALRLPAGTISGTGLSVLRELPALSELALGSSPITDEGLKHLRGTKLTSLDLPLTKITDAGLDDISILTSLTLLNLQGTLITDEGLQKLKTLKELRSLNVTGTKVTEAGVKKLAAALPLCHVQYTGGAIEPKKPPTHDEAAATLIDRGARVYVNGRQATTAADLMNPMTVSLILESGPFLDLKGPQVGWDEAKTGGVAEPFNDAELAGLAGGLKLHAFGYILLIGQNVTDDGIAALLAVPTVQKLNLLRVSHCGVGDETVRHAAALPALKALYMNDTKVTDAGVKHLLTRADTLDALRLANTAVTDNAIPDLKQLSLLTVLDLKGTKVSEKGARELAAALQRHLADNLSTVLDWYHAAEHLCHFAAVRFGADDPTRTNWAADAKGVLYERGGEALLVHLRAVALPAGSRAEAVEELRKLIGYVENNRHRTDYPGYRAKGWDIGSGSTEAGCKIIGDRLQGSGMRWVYDGAATVGALRALYVSGPKVWDGFWSQAYTLAA